MLNLNVKFESIFVKVAIWLKKKHHILGKVFKVLGTVHDISCHMVKLVKYYHTKIPSSFLAGSLQAILHMLTKELKYLSKVSSVFFSSRASALNWDQSKAFLSVSYTTPNDDTVR